MRKKWVVRVRHMVMDIEKTKSFALLFNAMMFAKREVKLGYEVTIHEDREVKSHD